MLRIAFALLLAALVGAAGFAAQTVTSDEAVAQSAQYRKGKPLRGKVYYGRRGGYSYKSNDTMSQGEARRFYDPGATRQSSNGPFDNGFFFDSAIGPRGGDAPYMH